MSIFGTKAETLLRLRALTKRGVISDSECFTVAEWNQSPQHIINKVMRRFGPGRIAIRSSACNEDARVRSFAGAYTSCLNVDASQPEAIRLAFLEVIDSYSGNLRDQVLVQPMLKEVLLSGVAMTHDLDLGAPYYIINYDDESGKTDTITGGTGVNKTVVIHREFGINFVESPRVAELVEMLRELETICGHREPLDVEFAKTSEQLHILQVRRIAVQNNWNRRVSARVSESLYFLEKFITRRSAPRPGIAGDRTILGQMPDWNPAEIIGTHPRPLATSLYRHLITDSVWQEARASMGYQPVPNECLMVDLAGQPFIDVRNSFNSFLPVGIDREVRRKIINAWLDRLDRHPEFHDKVEFNVAQTVVDFTFEENHRAWYSNVLSRAEFQQYREALTNLTRANLTLARSGSLASALHLVAELQQMQKVESLPASFADTDVSSLPELLGRCRDWGTRPFSVIARHAFIAESLLRSLVARGALTFERLNAFRRSLLSITTQFTRDFSRAVKAEMSQRDFLKIYGHLRPGTYDLMSLRYDQREDLFGVAHADQEEADRERFELSPAEQHSFQLLLKEIGIGSMDSKEFLEYARLAITSREHSKFVFSRDLSDSLEVIAHWGESFGLTRDDLSFLTIRDILETVCSPLLDDNEVVLKDVSENRRRLAEAAKGVRLGYILRGIKDLYVVPLHRSAPNFVSLKRIEGSPLRLDSRSTASANLYGKIILIENADPGFDWVFTHDIGGLISKFGGANSHMTIRCAELGLPAAIGVGEQSFDRLASAQRIELDAGQKIVRPIYG